MKRFRDRIISYYKEANRVEDIDNSTEEGNTHYKKKVRLVKHPLHITTPPSPPSSPSSPSQLPIDVLIPATPPSEHSECSYNLSVGLYYECELN